MPPSKENHPEWLALHKSYDQFEAFALIIKIVAIVLTFASFIFDIHLMSLIVLLLVLWLQEGIWKTFQSRTEERLLDIESNNDANNAFKFYSNWSNNKPSTIGLILEYVKNAIRPTVAFPYAVLIIASLLLSPFFNA